MASELRELHRHTTLASALDILLHRRLALVSPSKWLDQNDTEYIKEYQRRRNAAMVLTLCLTKAAETSHHWSSFAPGTDGVRIEISSEALTRAVAACDGMRCEKVTYAEVRSLASNPIDTDDLPFRKRFPYRGEEEVRLLYTNQAKAMDLFHLPLPADTIVRMVVGPN